MTLTPALREARERLRRRGLEPSVGELALVGAERMLADAEADEAEEERRRKLRVELARSLRDGDAGFDAEALEYIHEHGWIHT